MEPRGLNPNHINPAPQTETLTGSLCSTTRSALINPEPPAEALKRALKEPYINGPLNGTHEVGFNKPREAPGRLPLPVLAPRLREMGEGGLPLKGSTTPIGGPLRVL